MYGLLKVGPYYTVRGGDSCIYLGRNRWLTNLTLFSFYEAYETEKLLSCIQTFIDANAYTKSKRSEVSWQRAGHL
jgi:hypothetical protein